jgi:hypothetical protein
VKLNGFADRFPKLKIVSVKRIASAQIFQQCFGLLQLQGPRALPQSLRQSSVSDKRCFWTGRGRKKLRQDRPKAIIDFSGTQVNQNRL